VIVPGRVQSMNLREMNLQFRGGTIRWGRGIDGEHAPKEVVAAAQPGDLFATMPETPEGVASACALSLPDFSEDQFSRKIDAHRDKVQVICADIPENASLVTIEVPPFPRLE
jgi:hypothetical protein